MSLFKSTSLLPLFCEQEVHICSNARKPSSYPSAFHHILILSSSPTLPRAHSRLLYPPSPTGHTQSCKFQLDQATESHVLGATELRALFISKSRSFQLPEGFLSFSRWGQVQPKFHTRKWYLPSHQFPRLDLFPD